MDNNSLTTELVDRLRDKAHCNDWYLRQEAADEIERLRAKKVPVLPVGQVLMGRGILADCNNVLFRFDADAGTVEMI